MASTASTAPTIFHITKRASWEATLAREAAFEALSLQTEGFIHCSTSEQAAWVANQRFRGSAEALVLLQLDTDRLSSEVKWEFSEAGRAAFPHIYGPIDLKAVVAVLPFVEGPEGFTAPAGDQLS
jgi:uncharacterized protein (DUF952 family)